MPRMQIVHQLTRQLALVQLLPCPKVERLQWSSVVISDHQWSSVIISGHQWSSVILRDHQWSSEPKN